jgi:CRISPR/Cas system-associated exonuclease Cas4 (RecB family)
MGADLRETIGDDLYTSITQLKSWMLCPRQFELHYVRGESPEFVPKARAFGTSFHSALARYYVDLRDIGVAPPVEKLIELFSDLWQQKKEGKIPIQGAGDEDEDGKIDPVDLAAKMLRVFHGQAAPPDGVKVVAVEQPFSVTLFDPDTGEVQEEKLVGVIDLVLSEDDHVTLVEHKTAAKKWGLDQFRYDFQPTAYQLATKEQGHQEVGLRYQIVTKTKSPAVQVEDVMRDESDEDDFRRIALGVLKAIDNGVSYPVRGWQCRSCPYKAACSKRSKK